MKLRQIPSEDWFRWAIVCDHCDDTIDNVNGGLILLKDVESREPLGVYHKVTCDPDRDKPRPHHPWDELHHVIHDFSAS